MKIRVGQFYRVGKVSDGADSVKLVCFGIIPGKVIKVIRKSPFGGAYYVNCEGRRFGLSRNLFRALVLTEVSELPENESVRI